MQVTRYQMHNVLECYSKKLSRARGKEGSPGAPSKASADEIAPSSDTSRTAAMDKISRQVLAKVMDVVALSSTGKMSRHSMRATDAVARSAGDAAAVEFSFNGMDSSDRKRRARLAVGTPAE
jgi:hypothetical protein